MNTRERMLHGPVLPTLMRLATPNVPGLFSGASAVGTVNALCFASQGAGRLGWLLVRKNHIPATTLIDHLTVDDVHALRRVRPTRCGLRRP